MPCAEQDLVLDDHDPHGSSAVSVVPAPGRALDAQDAAQRGDPVGEPAQPGALERYRAADRRRP